MKKNKTNIAILGLGEVGFAIKKLVDQKHNTFVREIDSDEVAGQSIDIVHICIPYTSKFNSIVIDFINETKPDLAIINSTVKPGTTESIYKMTKADIVHAPILGVHPNLYDYLFKFTKFIGPVNESAYKKAKNHFEDLGVKTKRFNSPRETELAKTLSTTYYGWNIIFEKWVHKLCQDNQLDFDNVYTQYNQNYNQGYQEELPEVTRPVLKHHRGEIGGHCVIPNAQIIQDWIKDDFTKFILEQNKILGQTSKS